MSAPAEVRSPRDELSGDPSNRGILARPDALTFALRRVVPAPDVAWCVDRYWIVEWNRFDTSPGEGRVLPHPCVNVALEQGRLNAHGVSTEVFLRRLVGSGRVFGIKFRPGGFPSVRGPRCQHADEPRAAGR